MATFLTNPLPASDAKIRFMEPYVSNGLNRRTVGIIPEGIYRGFNVSAIGTTVTVAADVVTMDSVAVCETLDEAFVPNQFQLTVRHEGDFILDFSGLGPADYPNAIVMETVYDLTGTAPLTGVTTVTIKVLDLVDVLPEHVILCQTTKVGPNVIIDNTNREDNGGSLVTQTQLAGSGGGGATLALTEVNYAGGIQGVGSGTFVDVTGVTIAFNLPVSGTVQFFASATALSQPFTQGNYVGLGINVNGTDYAGGGTGGQAFFAAGGGLLVTGGFTSGGSITVARALNLVAGAYTVKLRFLGSGYLENSVTFPTNLTAVYPILTGPTATASPITTLEAENATGTPTTNATTLYALIPSTSIALVLTGAQTVFFDGFATAGSAGLGFNTQLGIRIDGVDYDGPVAHGLNNDRAGLTLSKGISLSAGAHTAQLVLRQEIAGINAEILNAALRPTRLTALYTIPQTTNLIITQYTQVIDAVSGTFATAFGPVFPAFVAIPTPVGAFVQGGAAPSDVLVHITASSAVGAFFHDGTVLGIDLDAGPIQVVSSTTNSGLGDGRANAVGGTIKFTAVAPGPHTFNLHMSIGYGLAAAGVRRQGEAPLRIVISHT